MEVMLEGDAQGKPFAFPKPEIAIEPCFVYPDKWVESYDKLHPGVPTYDELYKMAFELASKFGTPYFDNMLPTYRGSGEGISCYQCCAYSFSTSQESDTTFQDKMYFKDGSHFSMGSWMVVSLNCPRAAYIANNFEVAGVRSDPIEVLKNLMDDAINIFKIKRDWMERQIKGDRIPFATQTPRDPNNHDVFAPAAIDLSRYVYTIGVIGIDDMVKAVTGQRMYESKESLAYGLKVIIEMKKYSLYLSETHGISIALARTPAETTAQRFATFDLRDPRFSEYAQEVVQGDVEYALEHIEESDLPIYYTNGTHVPPAAQVSMPERLDIESKFFPILDGGNIAHIWLGETRPNAEGLFDLGMLIAKNTQIGYFAFTRDFTICGDCGEISPGIYQECPRCQSISIDIISRIP